MKVMATKLDGVLLFQPVAFGDARGYLMEAWSSERYRSAGVAEDFVQDNVSVSSRGTLRGLHLQQPHGQGKLVTALQGEIFDVVVDVRRGSPTFGQWEGFVLSDENHNQLYVPPGFAHGFCVVSEKTLVHYKCTDFYVPDACLFLAWNDPELAIRWPVDSPLLSPRDASASTLAALGDKLPLYSP